MKGEPIFTKYLHDLFTERIALIPFLKIFLFTLLGVLTAWRLPESWSFGASCLLPALLILQFCFRKVPFTVPLLFCFGLALPWLQKPIPDLPENRKIEATLVVRESAPGFRYLTEVSVYREADDTLVRKSGERLLLLDDVAKADYDRKRRWKRFSPDLLLPAVMRGDTLRIPLLPERLESASFRNRHEYLDRGVAYYALNSDEPLHLSRTPGIDAPSVQRFSDKLYEVRSLCNERLDRLTLPEPDIAVLKAMLIGNTRDLSDETRDRYNRSGISHILAISGLHVGIITLLLNLLFGFLRSYRGRIVRAVLIIGILWGYALLTGLSDSVCRAALMFSFFQLMLAGKRSRYLSFNFLFATAFVFMAIDAESITRIGFQLSYMAVLSILLFHERITGFLPTRSRTKWKRLAAGFGSSVLLTVSAQILVIPLLLHYFASVSTLSLLTNTVTVLLLPLILGGGILFMIFPLPVLSDLLGMLFRILNRTVDFVNACPMSFVDNFRFSAYDLFVCYLAIALFLLWRECFFGKQPAEEADR